MLYLIQNAINIIKRFFISINIFFPLFIFAQQKVVLMNNNNGLVWDQPVYVQKKDSFFVFRKGELYVFPDDTLEITPVTSSPIILTPGQIADTIWVSPDNPFRYFVLPKDKQASEDNNTIVLPTVQIMTKLKNETILTQGGKHRKIKLYPGQYVRSVLQVGSSEKVKKFSKRIEVNILLMPARRLKKKIPTDRGYFLFRINIRKQPPGGNEEIISSYTSMRHISSVVRQGSICGLKKPINPGDKLIVEIKYLGFVNVIKPKKIGEWGTYVGQVDRTHKTYIRVPTFYLDSNQIQVYSILQLYDARKVLLDQKKHISVDFKFDAYLK